MNVFKCVATVNSEAEKPRTVMGRAVVRSLSLFAFTIVLHVLYSLIPNHCAVTC